MKQILQYKHVHPTVAMKHGTKNENRACVSTYKILLQSHQNVQMHESGLNINSEHPYIGSSPDRVVVCDCCGSVPLEVKNPFKHRNMSIVELSCERDSCLQNKDGQISLKTSHRYYYQCQTHMISTNATRCIFSLQTDHKDGFFSETVLRDQAIISLITRSYEFFWSALTFELFYETILKAELCGNILRELVDNVVKMSSSAALTRYTSNYTPTDDVTNADFNTAENVEIEADFTCHVCKKVCIDKPTKYVQKSIECSKCNFWFHMKCVGVKGSEEFVKNTDIDWTCFICASES